MAQTTALITTYKRPTLFHSLLVSLYANGIKNICIVDDASPEFYVQDALDAVKRMYDYEFNVSLHVNEENQGKKGYWMTENTLWDLAEKSRTKYFIRVPDDIMLVPNGLKKAISIWERLPGDKIALNVRRPAGRTGKNGWTQYVARPRGTEVLRCQWVDGLYICERKLFDTLGRVKHLPFQKRYSSGVGRDMSRRLHQGGHGMYIVRSSLVLTPLSDHSVMHPHERAKHPVKEVY